MFNCAILHLNGQCVISRHLNNRYADAGRVARRSRTCCPPTTRTHNARDGRVLLFPAPESEFRTCHLAVAKIPIHPPSSHLILVFPRAIFFFFHFLLPLRINLFSFLSLFYDLFHASIIVATISSSLYQLANSLTHSQPPTSASS